MGDLELSFDSGFGESTAAVYSKTFRIPLLGTLWLQFPDFPLHDNICSRHSIVSG